MYQNIYSIRDKKSQIYMQPFFALTDAAAVHMVKRSMEAEPNGDMSCYPSDYALNRIGEYRPDTGFISQDDIHVLVELDGIASDLAREQALRISRQKHYSLNFGEEKKLQDEKSDVDFSKVNPSITDIVNDK